MKSNTPGKDKEKTPVAVAFYRISTDKQQTDRQIQDVRRYCDAFGYNLPEKNEFKEVISGAAKLHERKELQALIKFVGDNKPDFVICSELSRLARSQDAVSIIKDWTDKGICFITLKENIRTLDKDGNKSPMTDLLLNIMTAINIFELESIKYRVRSGLRKTINTGTWSGGNAPFGYSIKDKKLLINHEAEHVKFIFERYADGWGNIKITSHLNLNKIPTKNNKTWTDTKVYKILSNSIYSGKRKWKTEIIDQPELRIVDDTIFTAVQNRLVNRLNNTTINKHNKYDYLLTGKIICSCGKHFIGQGRRNIYMCKSKKYGRGCNIKSVRINYLDNEISNHLNDHAKLLWDNSGISNKMKVMKDEILEYQTKIHEEKTRQNYFINNISKIGQQMFDQKFDASTELVDRLQKQIDTLNIKLSRTKTFVDNDDDKIRSGELIGSSILRRMIVDKEMMRKVIDHIDIDNDNINVNLINEKSFVIDRHNK